MASYEELRKKFVTEETATERMKESRAARQGARQSYDSQIETETKEEISAAEKRRQKAAELDKAISETLSKIIPQKKAQEETAPKRDAAAYQQAKEQAQLEKATVKYEQAKAAQARDAQTMNQRLDELAAWSDEDKRYLEQYVNERSNAQIYSLINGPQFDTYNMNPLIQKYGYDVVRQMAEAYERQQNEKAAMQAQQESAGMIRDDGNWVQKTGNAAGHSVASVGANFVGNITSAVGRLQEHQNRTGQFESLQQYTAGDIPSIYASAVRGEISENIAGDEYDENGNLIKEGGKVREGLSYLYQGGMSLADSIARSLTLGTGGGAALAAAGSFSQAIADASANGASPKQAVLMGVANAGMEYMSEKIPMDELFKIAKTADAKVWVNMLKQAGAEVPSELASLFGTMVAEAAILQEKSSYNQMIGDAIANGASYEEAKEQGSKAIWEQTKQTIAVSGFAGLLGGAGGSVVGKARNRNNTPVQTDVDVQTAPEVTQPTGAELARKVMKDTANEMQGVKADVQPETTARQLTPQERGIRYRASQVNTAILNLVDRVKNGLAKANEKVQLGTVSDANAAQIERETGIDARGYSVAIEARQIDHILKGHGENGDTNHSMANPEDIAKIEYALNNPDRITKSKPTRAYVTNKNGKMKPSDTVLYEAMLEDGSYYVVQAVPETNKKTLYVVTAFIGESGYNSKNPQSVNAVRPGATPAAESAITPAGDTQSVDANNLNASPEAKPVGSENIISSENQNVKGTGAAEQNFSGKAEYQDLLYEGNVQPDRATDVRPMEVPKTDTQGNPVSEVAANVYGSQFTPDDLASEMESSIANGELSYMKITNDKAAEKATATIEAAGGWDEAYIQFHDSVRDGVTSAEMAARGAMLLNHAAEVYEQVKATGNETAAKEAKQKWISILMDVREMGTNTAQGLQAMRMIRDLAPPDKLDFAVASIKRMVGKMNLGNDVKIDENLLNEYRMAETDEQRNEIMTQIQQNVADQIPSTFLDKWTALRYMNMLGNLKTNVRNVAGNIGAAVAYRVKDQVAATMEDFVSVFNKDFQRTKSHTVSAELLKAAIADFESVKSSVNSGGKFNERMSANGDLRQGIMDKRKVFNNKLLEGYRRGTNWMMNNQYFGDEAFGRGAYARALAGYLKANGVSGGDLSNVDSALMDKARSYAIKEAQEATFKDNTALANMASKLQKATGVVGQGIAPFTKTPANVLTRAIEFSPVGLVDSAVKAVKAANPDTEVTGTDVINSIAKSVTGTVLFGLGMLWQDQGFLFASESDDEEERKLDELSGKQPYSIEFEWLDGKKYSYTMDWVTPVSMPLFMGAELNKILQENGGTLGGLSFSDWVDVLTSVADPMIQMSMLQGINDSLNSIKFVENNLGQFVINAALSYLTQGLTNTLLGQIERSTEDTRTTTYVDENSNIPKFAQQAIGKASQKIPGWDYQQMEYRNVYGETEKNEGGLAYNLLSPGYISEVNSDAVNNELRRLNETQTEKIAPPDIPKKIDYTDSKGNVHNNYQLTEKQYQMLAQVQGQTAKKALDSLVASSSYKNLTDAQKAATIKAVYEYAAEKGKQTALGADYYSKADSWIAKTKAEDINAFITQGSKTVLNQVVGNTVEALANNWGVSTAAKSDLEQSWQAFDKMPAKTQQQILDSAASDTVKYLMARKDGVSMNTYLKATDSIKDLKPENGKSKVSAAQQYEAIVTTPNASTSEVDALIKVYMDDYDPNSVSPDTTELKYDYIREKMQLTPEQYVKVYRIYSDVKNGGLAEAKAQGYNDTKEAYTKQWQKMGLSDAQATELYNLLVTNGEKKIDVVEWSNK